ncbi:hypothetical protein OYT88_07005 [Sporolactobacillus sp. CQH2019]|uniref:hypothetical protein n=1 Tax=Sporolactobacillus sp. CQH2019 TaxID=3023512 RepID=UPI0023680169|nr:hypothetical protein [Sporolactobacillus sp. CQH2019]MDD9148296.1 hypothetical protein [Sporolactobacillus sp. CQH2019]
MRAATDDYRPETMVSVAPGSFSVCLGSVSVGTGDFSIVTLGLSVGTRSLSVAAGKGISFLISPRRR